MRCFYAGLKAALGGHTISQSMNQGNGIVVPSGLRGQVPWDSNMLTTAVREFEFRLGIPEQMVIQLFQAAASSPPSTDQEPYVRHWLRLIITFECIRCNIPIPRGLTLAFQSTRQRVISSITPGELADLLLESRPQRGAKALQAELINNVLNNAFPNSPNEVKRQFLAERVEELFEIFPHSIPRHKKDFCNFFWRVGNPPTDAEFKEAITTLNQKFPITLQSIPNLITQYLCPTNIQITEGWEVILGLIRHFRPPLPRREVLLTGLLILATASKKMQNPQQGDRHPFFNWREVRLAIPNLNNIAAFFINRGLVLAAQGFSNDRTIANALHVPVDFMTRLRRSHDLLVGLRIIHPQGEQEEEQQREPNFEVQLIDPVDVLPEVAQNLPRPRRHRRRVIDILLADA